MANLIDRLAGYAGCTTDMQCQQMADVIGIGVALAFLGACMIVGGYIEQRRAVTLRRGRRF